MDAEDSEATDAEKTAADDAITDHMANRNATLQAFEEAEQAKTQKENMISEGARMRDEQEYQAMKQERDALFYDLEGLKMDEEAQVQAFQDEADWWYHEGLWALENDDYEYFKEANAYRDDILKQMETAQAKLETTEAKFEVERAAKDARELEEATNAALAEFELRSGERKTQFDDVQGELNTAQGELDANLQAIEDL